MNRSKCLTPMNKLALCQKMNRIQERLITNDDLYNSSYRADLADLRMYI